ncbi:MAG: hypothetical protein NZM31_09040 [Gemmatales bacterium]|nr:hypothetical protein [Gemmatales bacterium]MDW8387138.1 hypothetical protein [Gemmatales bacterium]
MATATPPAPTKPERWLNFDQPLGKLGQAIRTYVLIEGIALAAIFLCGWMGVVFLLDWGTFALLGIDYVREAPETLHLLVRWLFLGVLLAGLVYLLGYKVLFRLLVPFRPAALALLLERRFPNVLQDRLVTAVELADLEAAAEMGYSPEMVAATARSAAAKVEEVPLLQVLNWTRLQRLVVAAVVCTAAMLALALLATDTFARFLERDLLLRSVYWPQPIVLDVLGFAEGERKAVPHGGDLRVTVRAYRFVVADASHPEGWRPVTWSDVLPAAGNSRPSRRPWELDRLAFSTEIWQALPETWRLMTIDDLIARLQHAKASENTISPASVDDELGFACIDFLRERLANSSSSMGSLGPDLTDLLPEAWQNLPAEELADLLRAVKTLKPVEAARLTTLLRGTTLTPSDGAQILNAAVSSIAPPILTAGMVQGILSHLNPEAPALLLSESDRDMLPKSWRDLSARQIQDRIHAFVQEHTPASFGARMRNRLDRFIADLEACSQVSHIGRRRYFRALQIPDEVTIEFEQLLSEEERGQFKPRLGKPRVRRQLQSHEFVYEFKKIDRPMRFRVLAGSVATPWRRIDVKELPTLRRLTRMQKEPGYLHGSNARVPVGPLPVSLEGEESLIEIPSGSLVEFEGVSQKTLRWVRIALPGQAEHQLWSKCTMTALGSALLGSAAPSAVVGGIGLTAFVERSNPFVRNLEHQPSTAEFRFALHELVADDLKLNIEFEDEDGILGGRRLLLRVVADKEPEFKRAQPEIVRRKMITPLAVIPFSIHLHDDHGLMSAHYEVTVEQMDRKVVIKKVFPLRRFRPLRLPDDPPDDLAFEKRGDITPARLLLGPWGERLTTARTLPLLPLTGPLAFAQPPVLQTVQDYSVEFQIRPGTEPVLSPDDEFFDTLLLREQPNFAVPSESSPAPLSVPYRLTVRLIAQDNRVRTGPEGRPEPSPQEGRSAETFDFIVVSEEELLIENNKREEDLRDRCEAIIANIQKARMSILKRLRDDFDMQFKIGDRPYDFRRAAADASDMQKLLLENQLALDNEVSKAFREIYRELVLNRCKEQVVDRIDKRICRPLETIVQPGQHFDRAQRSCEELARRLQSETSATPRAAVEEAIERTDQLVQRLEEILAEMRKLIEFNQALKVLQEIIDKQREILEAIRKKEREERIRELQDK